MTNREKLMNMNFVDLLMKINIELDDISSGDFCVIDVLADGCNGCKNFRNCKICLESWLNQEDSDNES